AVASPDERRGAVVKAFIVLAAGHEPSEELAAEISDFVRRRLSQYAYPRKVEFVDELPKKSFLNEGTRSLTTNAVGIRRQAGRDRWLSRRGSFRMSCGSCSSRCCRRRSGGFAIPVGSVWMTGWRCRGSCSFCTPGSPGSTCRASSA